MENNPIDKIKLMMSYQLGKTLTENLTSNNLIKETELPIDEAEGGEVLKDLVGMGKTLHSDVATAFNNVINFAKETKSPIVIKDAASGGSGLRQVVDAADLAKAIRAGTIESKELAKVNFGLFKAKGASENTLNLLATDIVNSPKFIEEYKNLWISGKGDTTKLKETLLGRGYTNSGADALINKMNSIPNYGKDVAALEKGAAKAKKGSTKDKATIKKQKADILTKDEKIKELENLVANPTTTTKGEAIPTISNQVTNNFGTITKESAAETNAAVNGAKNIAPEVKATANEASTVVKEMKPSRWERWKAWAKKNPKSSKALIFLGLSLTGWALYKMFSSNDRKDEVKKTLFANCAGDLLDTQNSQILSMEDGSPVIYVSPTGNKEYDSKKGLKFLSNNRVFSGDNTMRGTWGCKGGTIGVQSEQTTGLPGADLGLSALTKMAQNKAINKADNVGNILNKINITWDSKSNGGGNGGDGTTGGGTQSTIPTELKDTDGVKKFQTWLDSKHGGWHSKYGTLNDNTLKGWGKYGPNTTKAWSQYKDEYLNGSTASGTETPNPSAEVDVTKPSGIPGSPDMVGKSGLNLDVNRIKVTNQDVSKELNKEIQPSNTELTDREKEILSNVKNRGVDKVYKGGTLTPEEQQWLSKYYGGVIKKIKNEKGYGQKTVIDVPKKDDTPKEPLSEENIIKKIVTKHLRSKL